MIVAMIARIVHVRLWSIGYLTCARHIEIWQGSRVVSICLCGTLYPDAISSRLAIEPRRAARSLQKKKNIIRGTPYSRARAVRVWKLMAIPNRLVFLFGLFGTYYIVRRFLMVAIIINQCEWMVASQQCMMRNVCLHLACVRFLRRGVSVGQGHRHNIAFAIFRVRPPGIALER